MVEQSSAARVQSIRAYLSTHSPEPLDLEDIAADGCVGIRASRRRAHLHTEVRPLEVGAQTEDYFVPKDLLEVGAVRQVSLVAPHDITAANPVRLLVDGRDEDTIPAALFTTLDASFIALHMLALLTKKE